MRRITPLMLVAALAACVACSGPEKTPETKTVEQASHDETHGDDHHDDSDQGDGIAWHDKTHDQQHAFMKHTVMPEMKATFQAFKPDKFADFKCSTCHGDDAKERHFEMPNPSLPKLDDFAKWEAEHPDDMEFMKTKVVPQMAALLGEEPYNPETKQGFGCFECHTR